MMSKDFDPYHVWLGIPPRDQPPHHYRLLGLTNFEKDPGAIENAADRAMAHLRTFQGGSQSKFSQKLLNEVAAARLVLLDQKKRAAYDERLRQVLAKKKGQAQAKGAAARPVPQAKPLAAAAPPDDDSTPGVAIRTDETTSVALARRRSRGSAWVMPAILCGMGLAVAVAFVVYSGGDNPDPLQLKLVRVEPQSLNEHAQLKVTLSVGDPEHFRDKVRYELVDGPEGARVDASTGAVTWTASEADGGAKHTIDVRAVGPNDQVDSAHFDVQVSEVNTAPSLVPVDRKTIDAGQTLAFSLEGRDTDEPVNKLTFTQIGGPTQAMLDVNSGLFQWTPGTSDAGEHMFTIRVTDDGSPPHSSEGTFAVSVAAALPELSEPVQTVDLLALVDVEQDTMRGSWQLDDNGLRSDRSRRAQIEIPLAPEGPYRLRTEISRLEGNDGFAVTLPVGERYVRLIVAGFPPHGFSGLDQIDNVRAHENATATRAITIVNDLTYLMEVLVQWEDDQARIRVDIDGESAIEWTGKSSALSVIPDTKPTHDGALALFSNLASWKFHDTKLDLFSGKARRIREPVIVAKRVPLPKEAARAEAAAKVAEVFSDQIAAAKTADEQVAIMQMFLEEAEATDDDLAVRYALVDQARQLAIAAGNAPLAVKCAKKIGDWFEVDALATQVETLGLAAPKARNEEQVQALAQQTTQLANAAVEAGVYPTAEEILQVAIVAARRVRARELTKALVDRKNEVSEIATAYEQSKQALAKVADGVQDPETNLAAARFCCFYQGDWKRGLSLLAAGSDEDLKQLATAELENPTEPQAIVAIADRWWEAAGSHRGVAQRQIHTHAEAIYRQVRPRLSGGIAATKVDKRLEEFAKLYSDATSSTSSSVEVGKYDHRRYKLRNTFNAHVQAGRAVRFLPNGQRLVTSATGHSLRVWNAETSERLLDLRNPAPGIPAIGVSPDGRVVATANARSVVLWDLAAGRQITTLSAHTAKVRGVTFARDGKTLASCSEDGTAIIWDLGSGRPRATLDGASGRVTSIAISPSGGLLATGHQFNVAKLWDVAQGREITTLKGHTDSVKAVAFSPDGKLLATGSIDRTVKFWNVAKKNVVGTLVGHRGEVLSLAFSPRGDVIAAGGMDDSIRLWSTSTGKPLAVLSNHTGNVTGLDFSPDGRLLASIAGDRSIRLWEFEPTRRPSRPPAGREHPVLGYTMLAHPENAVLFNGHWYAVVPGKVTWPEAQARCQQMGGYLVCAESTEEVRYVSALASRVVAWMGGLRDEGGTWRWINGQPMTATNWGLGQPDFFMGREDRMVSRDDTRWNDLPGNGRATIEGFICEWEF